jgi:AcrR family transcriptional regulator
MRMAYADRTLRPLRDAHLPPHERLAAYFETLEWFFLYSELRGCGPQASLLGHGREVLDETLSLLSQALRELQVVPGQAEPLAGVVLAACQGALLLACISGDASDLGLQLRHIHTVCLRAADAPLPFFSSHVKETLQ